MIEEIRMTTGNNIFTACKLGTSEILDRKKSINHTGGYVTRRKIYTTTQNEILDLLST